MNDLISRQAAIDALEWKLAGKAAIDAIKQLPPAQRWIPVTESLPENNTEVLAFLLWGGFSVVDYRHNSFFGFNSLSALPKNVVLAWMPLPEPYKEVE